MAERESVWIPGGTFVMGSNEFYPEERPAHEVIVEGFWMDVHPVTIGDFRRFVEATGYVTVAERAPNAMDYPGVDPSQLVPGSLVFHRPPQRVPLTDPRRWWRYVAGACWHRPEGPGSSVEERDRHPVTHVAFEDANAFAHWAGKSLPTEVEWERAARGGLEGATYVWGNELTPHGRIMANTWQGEFPWQNLATDGFEGTSPVGSFPPNGYGLFDMTGNVWEWTCDRFTADHLPAKRCCSPSGRRPDDAAIPRRVVKGGSHLCAPNYCLRYRPAARQGESVDTSTCHIGFRCIVRTHQIANERQ
jgi:formylglycine-generating enzyme required for sulfatase activity